MRLQLRQLAPFFRLQSHISDCENGLKKIINDHVICAYWSSILSSPFPATRTLIALRTPHTAVAHGHPRIARPPTRLLQILSTSPDASPPRLGLVRKRPSGARRRRS